ncbi:MAG: RNA polymerase sigma factor [Planctomycetota bacterium]|nr:RNA polymerase sigma factor [Planctomycetota bacterium]
MKSVTTQLTDKEAIQLCCLNPGDRKAFRTLYDRYVQDIFEMLRRLLWNPQQAEDALQETFIRFYQNLSSYDTERPLRPYLLKIAHNIAIDQLRSRKRIIVTKAQLTEDVKGEDTVQKAARQAEIKEIVDLALTRLDTDQRAILILRHIQELKMHEIATVLSCSERAARTRLRSASLLLAREIDQIQMGPGEEKL